MTLASLALCRIVRGVRSQQRYLCLACLGAFVAIGLHSFADFGLHIPVNAVVLAWILGLGCSGSPTGTQLLKSTRIANALHGIVVTYTLLSWSIIELRGYIDESGNKRFADLVRGTKKRQQQDIAAAQDCWAAYKRRKKQEIQ